MTTAELDILELEYISEEESEGSGEGDLNGSLSSDISIEKVDRSLSEFKRWFDEGDLKIDPEWQRNYVWNKKQASKLIESFLLGIPVPVVYLSKTPDDQYEVIDGLQRLKSVFDFFGNDFELTGLDLLDKENGKKFSELDRVSQRKLQNASLRSFELASDTDADMHFIVFERLNTGGTRLNEMEIRNCIFRGGLNDLIKDLADNADFKTCVNYGTLAKRMDDRALVLRFLAFYERTHLRFDKGYKKFLNDFLEAYRYPSSSKATEYRKVFEKCMKASRTVFGEYGYRLKVDAGKDTRSEGEWSPRYNAAIFQCISTSFSQFDLGLITRNADRIYEEYLDLVTSDSHWTDCVRRTTGDKSRLTYVFDTWLERLKRIMEAGIPNDKRRIFSKNLKKEMFTQDNACSLCSSEIKLIDDAVLDHEQHYWRGGQTVPENARLAHRYCNSTRPN